MFEKEAEEWVENNLHSTEEDYIKAFKDGAEYGYNKAKEEIRDILQRWYDQHHDKTYTETFYQRLIEDTEKLLWVDTKGE